MKESMYEKNMNMINRRIDAGLALLRESYKVTEVDPGRFESIALPGSTSKVKQYDIEGVGNMSILVNTGSDAMQLDTITITPYYKNLPLFSTDYMYFDDKRIVINEVDDLVAYKDDLYNEYIQKFTDNCSMVADLPNMPSKPYWYDAVRSAAVMKIAPVESDELILDLYLKNLAIFIEMEKNSPLLSDEQRSEKWQKNKEYALGLVENGGVSTDLFVQVLGADETRNFFSKVFFAFDRYCPDK